MMLITDIEQLKATVKLNANIPFESVAPYIADATDIYLEPNVGAAILSKADTDDALNEKLCRALGPLSMSLATDELGIQYGDAGITVQNKQGERSPASDTKIAAAKQNLYFRGMQALDRLLAWLAARPEEYPEYGEYAENITPGGCLIRSARQYQDEGLVDIDYSTLSYRSMLPVLLQIQVRNISQMLGEEVYLKLLQGDDSVKGLRLPCVRYLANKCAELHTSQTSRTQRLNGTQPEFAPLIRPLYTDQTDTGNYYASQADFYAGQIASWLEQQNPQPEEGDGTPSALDWNRRDKHLFASF